MRRWIESEYQPSAGDGAAVDALQGAIRNLARDQRPGKPRHDECCRLLKLFHALRAKLDSFGNSALCKVLAGERQSRLPRVNRDDSQHRPGARGFDGEPADARADIEKRYRDVGLWNRLEKLRADRPTVSREMSIAGTANLAHRRHTIFSPHVTSRLPRYSGIVPEDMTKSA
jgi:hypothetical protein